MSAEQSAIGRSSLIGLLLVQLLVLLPLLPVLPRWFMALALLVWLWRFLLLQMRRGLPSRGLKTVLVLAALAAIFLHFGAFIQLEAVITLLCTVYCLKLLEMRQRSDARLVCALSFFILGCVFLFDRSILISLWVLLGLWVLIAVLIGLAQPGARPAYAEHAALAARLIAKALPLMLVLFLLAPRMGPLWTVPMAAHEGRTGLSDEMAPGDIARLSQSDALVFRARFDGAIPPRQELYWRAMTLSAFDGRRWSRLDEPLLALRQGLPLSQLRSRGQQSPWVGAGDALDYELMLEPSATPWLYSLASVRSSDQPLLFTRDFNLRRQPRAVARANYRLSSVPAAVRDPELPGWLARLNLALPEGNPRTRQLAATLRAEAGGDAKRLLAEALARYGREPYVYTLRPPLLSGDTIDDFLFRSRRGFCAHYAGSLVFVLRAAGVPARIVAGYQGGEIDPAGFVQVRQFDAHAWVEAWLPGQGWVSVDPTAAVAPERVEQGLAEATRAEGSFLEEQPLSPLRYQHLAWLNQLRRQWDRMEYRWQRWVIGFDAARQQDLLARWLGAGVNWKAGLLLVLGCAGCLLLYSAWSLWRGRVPRSELERLFLRFCARLERRGFARAGGETALQLVARIAAADPILAEQAGDFARLYTRMSFDPGCPRERAQYRLLRRYLTRV